MKKLMIIALALSALLLAGCAADKPAETASTPVETASAPAETASTPAETASTPAETTAQATYQFITPVNAQTMIGTEGVVLLDVRTQEEYAEAHIEGAQLLPYDEISQRTSELPADKDTTIIVYCRSGRRSAIAAQTLADMGYTQVYDLGGIQSWPYGTVTGG